MAVVKESTFSPIFTLQEASAFGGHREGVMPQLDSEQWTSSPNPPVEWGSDISEGPTLSEP